MLLFCAVLTTHMTLHTRPSFCVHIIMGARRSILHITGYQEVPVKRISENAAALAYAVGQMCGERHTCRVAWMLRSWLDQSLATLDGSAEGLIPQRALEAEHAFTFEGAAGSSEQCVLLHDCS